MNQIRIKNLRSLKDTGYVDLKPLTLLVGKNSSGKSTFLRFFPLMKQTLSTKKNEPILWYSKEYVDFGSFEDSINRENQGKAIGFEFKFDLFSDFNLPTLLKVNIKEKIIQDIEINIFDNTIKINLNKTNKYKLSINDFKVETDLEVSRPNVLETLIPNFTLREIPTEEKLNRFINRYSVLNNYFNELLYNKLLSKIEKNKDQEFQSSLRSDVEKFMQELNLQYLYKILTSDETFLTDLEKELREHSSSNYQILSLFDDEKNRDDRENRSNDVIEILKELDPEELQTYTNILIGSYIYSIIDTCNEYLNYFFSEVHYIAPLRASAQRYYRLQGLSVDEIDPQGENIPMALNHLDEFKKEKFKLWMKMNFGFEIETKVNGGHITLNISFGNNECLNLADTGFGFSQILPILLLLWRVENKEFISRKSIYRKKNNKIHNIVIEQPELHLHPALQAKLTDTLVKCIEVSRHRGIHLNIILETHSETIVNRIGQLVYNRKINKELINVIIFGDLASQNPSESCLHSVSYDEEGAIEDWPLGFFYPEV